MPLPWLIGAAALLVAKAVIDVVSDDAKPSASSSTSSGDAERRRQELAAAREHKEKGLKTRIANLEKDRRDQLSKQLQTAAQTLGLPEKAMAAGKTASQIEQAVAAKQSSGSAYGEAMKALLRADASFPAVNSKRFLVQLNVLETLTAPLTPPAPDQQALAQLQQSAARIKRLQQIKKTVEQLV